MELALRDIVLSQLDTGSVLGDEIVASKTYQYSAIVKSSEIRLLELVRFQFQELKYFGLFDDLKNLHEQYKYCRLLTEELPEVNCRPGSRNT